MTPEERFERIERNIDTITSLVVQIAERQSVTEHELAEANKVRQVDGEHIRALARIAEIHERRLSDLEGNRPE